MIGTDFEVHVSHRMRYCSECGSRILAGVAALASIKNGRIRKTVCGQECASKFDARFWAAAARERISREARKRRQRRDSRRPSQGVTRA